MDIKIIDYSKFKYNTSKFMTSLFKRCTYENSKELHTLIKELNDINITDKYGNTLLHKAIHGMNIGLVAFLINNGININAQNKQGNTALHLLVEFLSHSEKKSLTLIKFLCECGANIYLQNKEGLSIIDIIMASCERFDYYTRINTIEEFNDDIDLYEHKKGLDISTCLELLNIKLTYYKHHHPTLIDIIEYYIMIFEYLQQYNNKY